MDKEKAMFNRVAKKSVATPLPQSFPTRHSGTRRQAALKAMQAKRQEDDYFIPENSAREKRKLEKKLNIRTKELANRFNDENGVHIATGIDLCDCLNIHCIGCFFPCPKCKGTKCGHECRSYRKYKYDSCDYHGYTYTITNPLDKESSFLN